MCSRRAERLVLGEVEVRLASVPGVSWKTIFTPSIVSSCPWAVMSIVGAMSVGLSPVDVVWAEPRSDLRTLSDTAPYM